MRSLQSHVFCLGLAALGLWGPRAAADEQNPAAATIVVRLPADAQLTFDGQATQSKSALRRFVTPPIEPNKRHTYTVQARWQRGPTTVTVEKVVPVQAGQETMVNLDFAPREVYAPAPAYGYGAVRAFSGPVRSYSPQVAPLSGQDPLRNVPAVELRDPARP